MVNEEHIQSAIIGYYRQGAWITEISNVTNLSIDYIAWVIKNYFNAKLA
jgi:hypothetical protein